MTLTDAGQLAVSTPVGGFTDARPYAYQDGSGGRDEVPAAFALVASAADGPHGYGFKVGRYDRSRPLVLDPSMLIYAGYIGGSGNDVANGIAVDAAGNAYVVGTTSSPVPSFPGKVGPDLIFNGNTDAFVAKIKADGSDFVYLGYIGGAERDEGTAIAVDKAGNAYVTGRTFSDQSTFPVKVGPSLVFGGETDAFVAKVKPDGTGVVYCGYIGGAGSDGGSGIAVDAGGNAYITGDTDSDQTSFPVKGGPDLNFSGGEGDAFVAKVKADGTGLVYAGFIGGAGLDVGSAIALDAAGNAYIAGTTDSNQTSFPVKVGPDLNFNLGSADAFVAKVKADGSALVYLGYIGGANFDVGHAIAVDTAGNAYVTGFTNSDQTTFPVKVGPDLIFGGGVDAFVAKVKADGTTLLYAGYLGGANFDGGNAIAVDPAGNAYVAGFTQSDETSFPVKVGPTQVINGETDAFVAKVKADGTGLLYAGYIGGQRFDAAHAIAVDAAGNVYVAGLTSSDQNTFPVTVGPDRIFSGGDDAFVAKVSGKPDLAATFVNHGAGPRRPGDLLGVVDFVQNLGLGAAKASTTRYYLSTDTVKGANDIQLIGNHAVPSLEAGAFSNGSVTVTIPISTPPGFYHVLACADDAKALAENDETNNCFAPAFVLQVALPDLVVTGVNNPPAAAAAGSKILVGDTSLNVAAVGASASTTRYYLSTDGVKGAGDVLLTGSRAVPALSAQSGNASSGSVLVTIPTSTPAGVYRVLACADDLLAVKEAIETNNCAASVATLQVAVSDLVVTGVSNPPQTAKAGSQFLVNDNSVNVGAAPAPASTTRFYLSKDSSKGAGDILLAPVRAVPALSPNGQAGNLSFGSTLVTVPSSTAAGVYRVLACADDLNAVKEAVETNNCTAAFGSVQVTR